MGFTLLFFFLVSNELFAQIVPRSEPVEVLEDSVLVTIEVYDSYSGYPIQAIAKKESLSFKCNELGRVSIYC